ncbi:hypothetical protein HYO62_00550 [Aerococcaceae bacterium DSM 111022]|nr:hypothetical protein [Aerococcaceae bacterium DSM 111022]
MTDIVEMPNQGENYIRKGRNAAAELNYQTAINYFIKSYQNTPSGEALNEIIAYYLFLDNRDDLNTFLIEYDIQLEHFLENKELATFYIVICEMIEDNQSGVLNLYRLKQVVPNEYQLENLINQAIERLESKIALTQRFNKLAKEDKYGAILHQFYIQTPFDQLKYLDIFYGLSGNIVEKLLIPLLESDKIVSFVKTDILHYLIQNPVEKTIDYHWLNEKHELDLNKLQPLADNKMYQDTLKKIYELSEQDNPHLTNELIQQFHTQANSFYPFFDKVIKAPEDWYHAYNSLNGLTDLSDDEIDQNLLSYMKKVLQEYISHVDLNVTHHQQF